MSQWRDPNRRFLISGPNERTASVPEDRTEGAGHYPPSHSGRLVPGLVAIHHSKAMRRATR